MNNTPAFPNPHLRDDSGMTLRDYFAAKVMQALIARETELNLDLMMYARAAYDAADAMLIAREKIENSDDEKSISYLELSVRATNVLRAANIEKIGQLIERVENSDTFLAKLQNCGKITEREIKNALKERGFY